MTMNISEMDPMVRQYVDQQIANLSKKLQYNNAGNVLVDRTSGLASDAQNVKGLFGSQVDHRLLRLQATNQTISSGAIGATGSNILIDTESAASTDDLDTIHPTALIRDQEIIMIRPANTARTVVVKDGTGNINTSSGGFTMDTTEDSMLLMWSKRAGEWFEVARCDSALNISTLDTRVEDIESGWTVSTDSSLWDQSSSSPALGNGTIERRHKKVGDTVHVEFTLNIGSTTTMGVGAFLFELEDAVSSDNPWKEGFYGFAFDDSANRRYYIGGIANPGSTDLVGQIKQVSGTSLITGSLSQVAPFTFATDDWVMVKGTYESN